MLKSISWYLYFYLSPPPFPISRYWGQLPDKNPQLHLSLAGKFRGFFQQNPRAVLQRILLKNCSFLSYYTSLTFDTAQCILLWKKTNGKKEAAVHQVLYNISSWKKRTGSKGKVKKYKYLHKYINVSILQCERHSKFIFFFRSHSKSF